MTQKILRQASTMSLILLMLFSSCNGQSNAHKDKIVAQTTVQKETQSLKVNGKIVNELGKDIRDVLQDREGNYWFATYGEGIYYAKRERLFQITDKDGLGSNFVADIKEDSAGNLWFNTSEGLNKFDGNFFIDFADTLKNAPKEDLELEKEGLFFCYNGNVYHYDGKRFAQFVIHPATYKPSPTNLDRPYGVYCILKDKSGNIWFGTDQQGVCRYDGKTFTYFTEQGLNRGAVRAIFQDKRGDIWFGNNGFGLFRYDGKTLTNFTEQNGLGNPDFVNKKTTSARKANLARVWTINEDNEGNLWIGTIDNGAWKYDGKNLKNFTTKDGLANEKVSTIYKDKQNSLWFITEGEGISKLNGQTFEKVIK
ncbi:hypothetical protein DBR32_12650 [Taibaiella sp. KBW10]|uniref:ligand-binding sensor domain-containing protein n=1 Tax=Taibaiella sp. KBW10 TaxID=2153357 RepID=UPI000F59A59B|nr:two-component regulator propeller domain-containing protein [Taibaiella sp. KBW10]RQO30411.1 hypothetical protein DBR32_12650 [Taibaiella sp. KBW10]